MKQQHIEKYKVVGLKISYYRKLKGLTQEQLAEKIDKSVSFVGAVESPNIERTVSLDTLFDISEILEVPPYKFLKDD